MATANQKRRRAQLGKRNSNYKTGKSINSDGYPTIPTGERGGKRKLWHRAIVKALRGEKVHHINHNRSDARRSNLKRTKKHSGVGGK